jgi:CDP-diglyceride synthetase
MNDRIKRDWWIPAPIVLLGLSALAVLTHIVGDGFESAWSRSASGWNPSPFERVAVVALLGFLFVVLPVWALAIRRRHPGLTVLMLLPLGLYSLVPLMWGEVTWFQLASVLGIVTLVGAVMNLAERSIEEGSDLPPSQTQRASG